MFHGFLRAVKLELLNLKERKWSIFFYILIPAIIIWVFRASATMPITWGDYASLNLKMYDLVASDVFSLVILFVAVQLMVLRIVGERSPYGTLDRELIAISRTGMYFGKLLANALIVILQVALVYLVGYVIFPAKNYGNPIHVFFFLFLIGVFGLISGYTVSLFSKNKEQAVQLIPFFILLFLLFSGMLIKLDQMPANLRILAENLPFTLGVQSLKTLTLDGVGFEDVQWNVLKLGIWILLLVSMGVLKFVLEEK
ncbi:ABC transporter permease [Candidatus Woesearchaeota archaeon]|nr:ABC transporter permease [Candidatus Woesearchaeota archaeon]